MMVKQQAKASITAVLLSSSVGVLMAWNGFAYWSLATQGVVYVGLNTLLVWHYSTWRPSLKIDFTPVKTMFPFSFKIAATTIATKINDNVMNILWDVSTTMPLRVATTRLTSGTRSVICCCREC